MLKLIMTRSPNVQAVQVTKVENHTCDEWLTLETLTFNLFTVAQFTLSTQLINTKFCVSFPHLCSTPVSLETNPLVCQVTVGCAIFLRPLTVEKNELGFAWSTAMDGRPSDERALDFSADIGLIGPTPYALHTRMDSFSRKLYIREHGHTIDLPSGH